MLYESVLSQLTTANLSPCVTCVISWVNSERNANRRAVPQSTRGRSQSREILEDVRSKKDSSTDYTDLIEKTVILLTDNCSPLTAYYLLPTAHCSLLTAHCPPPTAHCVPLTAHCPLPKLTDSPAWGSLARELSCGALSKSYRPQDPALRHN